MASIGFWSWRFKVVTFCDYLMYCIYERSWWTNIYTLYIIEFWWWNVSKLRFTIYSLRIKVCKIFRNEDGIHYCILKRLPKMTNILAKFTDVTYICSIFRYHYLFILSSTQNTINRLPANQISNIIASAISFNNKIW